MSLYRSLLLFPSTDPVSPRLPLRVHSSPATLTQHRLGGRRRILRLRASPGFLCSSAMAIDDGATSSPSSLQVIEKFPHIQDFKAFQVPPGLDVYSLLKYQLVVAVLSSGEECTSVTGLQLPGVLDELFSYDGPLGATFSSESVYLHLWAPIAQKVSVLIYGEPEGGDPLEVVSLEESNGVWSAKGPLTWEGCYYAYEVHVYHPSTLKIEKCIANDPYARGLSGDGRRTLLVNVTSEALKPESWDNLADEKPKLLSFSDISIYELHVRDFSASDDTVPSEFRGGYLAFTCALECFILKGYPVLASHMFICYLHSSLLELMTIRKNGRV